MDAKPKHLFIVENTERLQKFSPVTLSIMLLLKNQLNILKVKKVKFNRKFYLAIREIDSQKNKGLIIIKD
jgi:ribosomal-protein-alanine N-acetyltransferase